MLQAVLVGLQLAQRELTQRLLDEAVERRDIGLVCPLGSFGATVQPEVRSAVGRCRQR